MQRTDTQKKIDALVKESKNLKISINQLKENLSKRHDNLPLSRTERNYFGSRYESIHNMFSSDSCVPCSPFTDIKSIREVLMQFLGRASHSVSKLIEHPKLLTKNLKISALINKLIYTNDEINLLDDGTCLYSADAVTGSVTFKVQFVVEVMKDKEMIVRSLEVTYLDPFHEAELKSFSRMCMRQNSMQALIRGVVSYAELFAKREEITNRLSEESESHFSVTKHLENGACNVTAKAEGRTTSYFSCEWKIIWNDGSLTMIHHFTIRASNETNFFKENECLFNKITSPGIAPEEVTELWLQLAKAVSVENKLTRQ